MVASRAFVASIVTRMDARLASSAVIFVTRAFACVTQGRPAAGDLDEPHGVKFALAEPIGAGGESREHQARDRMRHQPKAINP